MTSKQSYHGHRERLITPSRPGVSAIRSRIELRQPLKHTRYPCGFKERNKVTIGVGILTPDSVVLAADTQMSWTDFFMKTGEGKVSWSAKTEPRGTAPSLTAGMAITGAGHAKYVQHIQRHFANLITTDKHPSLADFRAHAETYLESFYKKHVAPISAKESERPNVWLLFAYQNADNEVALFSTSNNVVTPEHTYGVVGVGAPYAEMLLSRLFRMFWPIQTEEAILSAVYVIKNVKDNVPDCGKETDLIFLSKTGAVVLGPQTMKMLDALMEEAAFLEPYTISGIMSGRFKTETDTLPSAIAELRRKIIDCLHTDMAYSLWLRNIHVKVNS